MKAEHSLKRQLNLRDLVLAQVLSVLGTTWVGVAAGLGRAQALTWVAAMLLFYVPMGASVIALNRIMPFEGGLYVWAHRAFGDLAGFLIAWNLWVYGVEVAATIFDGLPTEISYLIGPSANWLPENHLASLTIAAGAIALITLAVARGLEIGKWIHNTGSIALIAAYAAVILAPLWAVMRHAPVSWTLFAPVLPAASMRNLALFGQLLVGALSGLEYMAILAGESRDPERNIGRSVWLASPIICGLFILGTSSVVSLIPGKEINFIAPIPQTLRVAMGSSGIGNILATCAILLLLIRLIGSTSLMVTGVTRLPMTAGWDHLAPQWFSRLHPKWGTPVNSVLFTGAAMLMLVIAANFGVHAQEAFQVLSNANQMHYDVAYLAMFAIPIGGAILLRRQLPKWLAWTSAAGFCSALFNMVLASYPFVDVVNAGAYAAKIIGAFLVINAVGVLFYFLRRKPPIAGSMSASDTRANAEGGSDASP